jgi:hydroxymethylglutaryl-CoA lyase
MKDDVAQFERLKGARVQIVEVGPRDGLQNERAAVSTADKVAFVNRLSTSGHTAIEVSAFVSPSWVPQMADAAEVFAAIERQPGVRYSALVPNLRGLARALEARVDEVAVFAAASETFSRRNINRSITESLQIYGAVCREAAAAGRRVRGYLSTAFGCPYEGGVAVQTVVDLTRQLIDLGVYEVAISDTIGVAHPAQVVEVLEALAREVEPAHIALHFHDTRGTALANVLAGLQAGIHTFDAAAGGLGGCPFAPGASGNLATEDLLYMLDGLGVESGVRLNDVMTASLALQPALGHALPSRMVQATLATRSPG